MPLLISNVFKSVLVSPKNGNFLRQNPFKMLILCNFSEKNSIGGSPKFSFSKYFVNMKIYRCVGWIFLFLFFSIFCMLKVGNKASRTDSSKRIKQFCHTCYDGVYYYAPFRNHLCNFAIVFTQIYLKFNRLTMGRGKQLTEAEKARISRLKIFRKNSL